MNSLLLKNYFLEIIFDCLVLNKQYIIVKKTTPRCLHKNDSVKNKLIIRTAKAI